MFLVDEAIAMANFYIFFCFPHTTTQQDERGRTLEDQLMKIHKRVEQMSRQRAREKRTADKKLMAYKTIVTKLSAGLKDVPPSSRRR